MSIIINLLQTRKLYILKFVSLANPLCPEHSNEWILLQHWCLSLSRPSLHLCRIRWWPSLWTTKAASSWRAWNPHWTWMRWNVWIRNRSQTPTNTKMSTPSWFLHTRRTTSQGRLTPSRGMTTCWRTTPVATYSPASSSWRRPDITLHNTLVPLI